MGTGNYTIMLGEDYMELLGVLNATEPNAPSRAHLERTGGGIERVAFTTPSAAAGAAELRSMGYAAIGPTDFERPVTLPDGRKAAAKFATFQWPVAEAPGGGRLFACQRRTPQTGWIAELRQPANPAVRSGRVVIVTPKVEEDARHLAKMIAGEVRGEDDGSAVVPTGFGRADFVLLTRDALGEMYPGVDVSTLPDRAGAGLELVVSDLAAAQRSIGAKAIAGGGAVVVPPAAANGVLLAFVEG